MGNVALHRRRWLYGTAAIIWLLTSILTARPATASQHADHSLAAAPTDVIVGRAYDDQHWYYSEEFPYFRPIPDRAPTYVGKVRVDAEMTLRGRTARWELSITWLDGPPVQRRIAWNCVERHQWVVVNGSCSNGWRTHLDHEGYSRSAWGKRARYHLEDDGIYWFDFTFGWRALTGYGDEAVWVARPDLPGTTWHFRCARRWCTFDPDNPTLT